ncbi:MAG: carotenoid 1,2-hydratase, partial [Pusillimonas sp.]
MGHTECCCTDHDHAGGADSSGQREACHVRWCRARSEGGLVKKVVLLAAWFWSVCVAFVPVAVASPSASVVYPAVKPGLVLSFPRDYGAHPAFRTEWWYVTGWLNADSGTPLGFQVTFFRSRPQLDPSNPSHFAPDQLLFAHAALSDPKVGRLQHAQRSARGGFGLADARVGDTDVHINDWSLKRNTDNTLSAFVKTDDFILEIRLEPTQPLLLQGRSGYSQKGPRPAQASYYYSQPQMKVTGFVTRHGGKQAVHGTAWLDHEWSSALLDSRAVGWDWTGINFYDGSALMAFRIRDKSGHKLWAGGSFRRAGGATTVLLPSAINFEGKRIWQSPHTGTEYPVSMIVNAGDVAVDLEPLMDDQELDSRASTGAVYWEGAVIAKHEGKPVGRGY